MVSINPNHPSIVTDGSVSPELGTDILTDITVAFDVPEALLAQITPMEVTLHESLLQPSLQTTIRCHSYFHNLPIKDLNLFKSAKVDIKAYRQMNKAFGAKPDIQVSQTVYRLGCFNTMDFRGERKLMNNNIEEFTIQACDHTLLTDAETLVTKMWPCTPPSAIVSEMLGSCLGATAVDVEPACCPRDYQAENIHPFQVINQQADVSLIGDSPSFFHYMTYENYGTHKFRSLDSLVTQSSVGTYWYDEAGIAGAGYQNPYSIMTHSFPCDFDLLIDLMNGIGSGGDMSSVLTFNPFTRSFGLGGTQPISGCSAATILKQIMTNSGSAADQFSCEDYAPLFALKRRARMSLLERDKIALKMTVPFSPDLNAGKVITLELKNKVEPDYLNYGSGDYLIHSLTHNLKYGGFSTTTVECVSTTVGGGVV